MKIVRGNLFKAPVEALVNAVNVVGVMGKGLALQFKTAFPDSARIYFEACKRGEFRVGKVLLTDSGVLQPRWIVHFPTKKHWRDPSRMEWVRDGLVDLVSVVRDHGIRSLALPALGCGLGGLPWPLVRGCIEDAMRELQDVEALVFEPHDAREQPAGTERPAPEFWHQGKRGGSVE